MENLNDKNTAISPINAKKPDIAPAKKPVQTPQPEKAKLTISNTPHIKSGSSSKRIMFDVLIALYPAAIMSCIYFGLKAVLLILLSVVSAVGSEIVYLLIRKENIKDILRKFDFTSAVTGLLIGLNLSPSCPFYVPVLGGIFGVVVVKMLFGGTGKNFVNPAIAARVFLLISFAGVMTAYGEPSIGSLRSAQMATGATSLGTVLEGRYPMSNLDLLLGTGVATGAIGETCKLALILGGVYLVIRKVIDWKWPVIYIVVTGLTNVLLQGAFGNFFVSLFTADGNLYKSTYMIYKTFTASVLSGGLILGAIFMATDYVTTPNTTLGNLIYFIALGLLTGVLRYLKNSEVVSYCILLMNFFVPLIDRYIVPKPFGYKKPEKVKEVKNG